MPDALEVTADIRIVLVEGNYLLHDRDGWERVAPLLDVTAYVDDDDELRRERLHRPAHRVRQDPGCGARLGARPRRGERAAHRGDRRPRAELRVGLD